MRKICSEHFESLARLPETPTQHGTEQIAADLRRRHRREGERQSVVPRKTPNEEGGTGEARRRLQDSVGRVEEKSEKSAKNRLRKTDDDDDDTKNIRKETTGDVAKQQSHAIRIVVAKVRLESFVVVVIFVEAREQKQRWRRRARTQRTSLR